MSRRFSFVDYLRQVKILLRLGAPILVGHLGVIVVSFADNIMVAHYSTEALAAASLVNNIFVLPFMLILGFSIGLTPLIGQHFARGDRKQMAAILRNGVEINTAFALLLSVFMTIFYFFLDYLNQPPELMPLIKDYYLVVLSSLWLVGVSCSAKQYFDGTGNVAIPMWISIISNIQNIVFNYLLIFGVCGFPEMGLNGAGVSTLASRITLAVTTVGVLAWHKRFRNDFRLARAAGRSASLAKKIINVSWPISLQCGLETAYFSIAGVMLGWIGAIALAGYQVMMIAGMLGFMVYESFASAICIRISHHYGTNEFREVSLVARSGFSIVLTFALIASLVFFTAGKWLIALITPDPEVIELCLLLIPPLITYQLADAMQVTYCNCLRGLAFVKPLSVISLVAYIILGIPVTYLFAFTLGGGAEGIFYSFATSLALAALLYFAVFGFRLRRLAAASA